MMDEYNEMCALIAAGDVAAFISELDSRWTQSKKHFNDVHANLESSLEANQVRHQTTPAQNSPPST